MTRRDSLRLAAGGTAGALLGGGAAAPARSAPQETARPGGPLPYTGANLAGAEFGPKKPGVIPVHGQEYSYPHANEVDYYASKGMNVFRIPFHWEAMQHQVRQPLVPEELARLKEIVAAITSRGLIAILDPHNYARFHGKTIGSPEVTAADFAHFWEQLSGEFRENERVWLGLMNEPHDMPDRDWLAAANAAVAAIRKTGARNLLLVPGNHWSGAHSWVRSSNGEVMLRVEDPLDHYVYDVHQYLDGNSSGSKPEVVSPTVGVERLRTFAEWCRQHKKKAFLGEFAVAANEEGRVAIRNMLSAMEKDRDVWVGFAWWGAGPRWGEYMFTIEPKNLQDRPQMAYLRPHLQPVSLAPRAALPP
ncbi:MAG TPA: glycoside hydrolase family 5 protein, partial [Armatimonadaceae bacterium]|nr:glycoside hydrolase family 5 protein [Armatimonadaceae bacterium]